MTSAVASVAPLEVGFCVADLARSLAFYRDALGLALVSEIDQPEALATKSGIAASGYRVVRLQLATGERIKLFAPTRAPAPAVARTDRPPLAAVGFGFLTLIVADLPAALARLAEHGFQARPPGAIRLRADVDIALVDDPDGNTIELVSYENLAAYRPDVTAAPKTTAA